MKNVSLVFVAGLVTCSFSLANGATEANSEAPTQPSQSIQYGGGAADLLNQTKTPEALQKPAGGMKVSMTCTDDNGKQHSQGDADYLRCMEEYKAKKSAPGSADSKSAAGFNFKIK